jgi:hypothetical protein
MLPARANEPVPVAATPVPVTAPAKARQLTLATRLASDDGVFVEEGTLVVTIAPAGTLDGSYRAPDGLPQRVTGGLSGEKIWFDIGAGGGDALPRAVRARSTTSGNAPRTLGRRGLHVSGTLRGDSLDATTFERDRSYTFKGAPKAAPAASPAPLRSYEPVP